MPPLVLDGVPGATDEFVVTASLLLDQELSVRLQATNDFVGMLTDQGLPEHEVGNITMYNMHVIREAILGMFASYGQRPVSLSQ